MTTAPTANVAKLREAWLTDLARSYEPHLQDMAAGQLPKYRVTCGFPSSGGMMGKKSRVRGECWSASASADGHAEIFISPVEDDRDTIAAILAHEMVHAIFPQAGHKGPFVKAMKNLGHVAPFTTSNATDEFFGWARPLINAVGDYPHAQLLAMSRVGAKKKQTSRLIKAECDACGYTVRVTRKWVDQAGAPHCPQHGAMIVEGADDAGDDEG